MFFANLITDWIWPGDGVHSYHWFHIMWLVLMVIGCFASSYFLGRKHNKKIDDRFIFIIGTMLILIEIYKQVFYTLDAGYFQWYAFPFQFCSVPMYVAFVAPLIKNEKIIASKVGGRWRIKKSDIEGYLGQTRNIVEVPL